MKKYIQKLLDSEISAYKIGKEAGVQDSLVKKLRNGDQKIEDTKFGNLEKLFNYAVKHSKEIEQPKSETKIPKSVYKFVENLAFSLAYVYEEKKKVIDTVLVYDKYFLDENGNSEYKKSYIEVDDTISLPSKEWNDYNSWIPYNINVKNQISDSKDIDQINDLKIIFDSEQLLNDLREEVIKGSTVKVRGSLFHRDSRVKTICVQDKTNNQAIFGYETNYFKIQYNTYLESEDGK